MTISVPIQGAMVPKGLQSKKLETLSLSHAHTLGELAKVAIEFFSICVLLSFNRIDLPPYKSYFDLKQKLKLAVDNTESFEIE